MASRLSARIADRRQHVFGTDLREGRQIVGLQKRLFALTVRIPWQKKHCPILITIEADRSRQPAYRHR